MEVYGGAVCSCCGETEMDFLCFDHIYGGGSIHRSHDQYAGANIYGWLKKNKYPAGFRVLCHNCNMSARLHNGVCIHAFNKLNQGER